MEISEVVKLAEHTLTDHKDALKDPSIATTLGEILGLSVQGGLTRFV
jgi:hypothetical protein